MPATGSQVIDFLKRSGSFFYYLVAIQEICATSICCTSKHSLKTYSATPFLCFIVLQIFQAFGLIMMSKVSHYNNFFYNTEDI